MSNIVKSTTFPNVFDLLMPHSCRGCGRIGNALCERCKKYIIDAHQNICPHCKTTTASGKCTNCPNLPPSFIIGERSNLLGSVIHDYKYHSIRALSKPLAELMHAFLPPSSHPTVIVPLPTIDRHIRSRGFDHTKLIAKHLANLQGPNCALSPILNRAKDTIQVGTNRSTRISQATDAYMVDPKATINSNTTYILLDDVWTTGASMQACIKKLQQAGASKIILAILALSRID